MKFLNLLSFCFFKKILLFSQLLIFITTIKTYGCFDCCKKESVFIKSSIIENVDKNEEKISDSPVDKKIYEKIESEDSLLQLDKPIDPTTSNIIISSNQNNDSNNQKQDESAPHFIDTVNNFNENFLSSPSQEKIDSCNFKDSSINQQTNTYSLQLGISRTFDSAQTAFNNTFKLDPAEQAVIFSQRKLSSSQNSFHSNSNCQKQTNINENNQAYQINNNHHLNNDNDDDNSDKNSQPSTIDSMVAKAAWATAIFQSDSSSLDKKSSSKGKSFSGKITSIFENSGAAQS